MSQVRRPNPLVLTVCALLFAAAVTTGCEDRGPLSELSFDFACPLGVPAAECISGPRDTQCLSAFVYVVMPDGTREQVRLFDPDEGYAADAGVAEIRADNVDRFRFRFDIAEVPAGTRVDLEFRLYPAENEAPALGATLENVTRELLAGSKLIVRLYPIGQWANAGEGETVARAFHQAVPLPSGDVLMLGGVRGENVGVNPGATETKARLVSAIELYDQSAHRFMTVTVPDGLSFTRVLFATRYLGTEAVGDQTLHRIRVIGGLTGLDGEEALGFAARGVDGPGGSPLVPVEGVQVGDTVDLLFDLGEEPALIEIREVPYRMEPNGARVTVTSQPVTSEDPSENDASGVVFPELGAGASGAVEAYRIDGQGNVAERYMLAHTRIGATATRLEAGATIVWGGNIATGAEDPNLTAGEVHVGAAASAVGTGLGAPPPTGFHRAVRAGPDLVLVVGGFRVQGLPELPAGPTSTYAEPPAAAIRLLQLGAGPSIQLLSDVPANGYTTSIFHTLNDLGGGRFLVTGGGTRNGDGLSRFVASDQAGVVTFAGYSAIDPLDEARFGHTATPLPGNRLLVHGGFRGNATGSVINPGLGGPGPEMIYLVDIDPLDILPLGGCRSVSEARDGGPGMDAAVPTPRDAGRADAGMMDAGPAIDAGPVTDGG